jgi:hypothetical protein
LREEELINMEQQDTLVIRISALGIEMAKQLKKRVRTNN